MHLPFSPSLCRTKKKSKYKGGRNLSCEARVVIANNKQELNKHPHSMCDFSTLEQGHAPAATPSPAPPPSHHSRRHTIHEVKVIELGHMTKKEKRQYQRTLSPQQNSEEDSGNPGTPKATKKQQKVQRSKDRDDKHRLPVGGGVSQGLDISRAHSEGSRIATAPLYIRRDDTDHTFIPRHVTESLNPMMHRRVSEAGGLCSSPGGGHERLRRTNSDVHVNMGPERRCPPERKQFYRHFIKSIKHFGINSAAASRMETPAPSHMPRFHSENLASSNPYSPLMEKLWMELKAYLLDRSTDHHKEWLFFNQGSVEKTLSKIIHYSCSSPDVTQSICSLSMPSSREGYKVLQSSYSSPTLGHRAAVAAEQIAGSPPKMLRVNVGVVSTAPTATDDPQPSANLESLVVEDTQPDLSEHAMCKTQHHEFFSVIQRLAVREVDCLLKELDDIETLFMNRRRMGDDHPKYRTFFFKHRVCALNLWQKVMHGLAENLCQLSTWLGTPVLLPGICLDSSPSAAAAFADTASALAPPSPLDSSSEVPPFLSSTSTEMLRVVDSSSCIVSERPPTCPRSPLVTSLRPKFSVGTQDGDSDEVDSPAGSCNGGETPRQPSIVSAAGTECSSDHYREFVSTALKRKGITFTVTVSTKKY